jgi:hypothetical protein
MALAQFARRHPRGDERNDGIRTIETAFRFEAVVERRRGQGREDADRRLRDTALLDEAELLVENRRIVVVETDDELPANVSGEILTYGPPTSTIAGSFASSSRSSSMRRCCTIIPVMPMTSKRRKSAQRGTKRLVGSTERSSALSE